MNEKKIVSIEDRIPKLKQARKKKANRRLIFYLSIFFFLISIIIYLQSPLSHIKTIAVKGNDSVLKEEIIEQSGLTNKTNIWTISPEKIKKSISKNPVIQSVHIKRKLPWTVTINVSEYEHIGYLEESGMFYPVLGNGTIADSLGQEKMKGDGPLLANFSDEAYLRKVAAELQEVPGNILNLVSEVHWKPADDNKNGIIMYMNDGFIVEGSIRGLAEKMTAYPSIVSQLEPDAKGIIHLGVGAYFESFDNMPDDEKTEGETEE